MKFQPSRRQCTLSFAAALALLALAAPTTSARPVEQFLGPQSSETACDRSGELHGTSATTCEQQALARAGQGALDYSKNSVSGEYAPAVPLTVKTATTADNPGFEWGAAAIGAGAAIALLLGSMAVLALIGRGRVRLAR
jgi:hypothetical protein